MHYTLYRDNLYPPSARSLSRGLMLHLVIRSILHVREPLMGREFNEVCLPSARSQLPLEYLN